jgi:alpha-beta hydrolase superfamily lysophospholipase
MSRNAPRLAAAFVTLVSAAPLAIPQPYIHTTESLAIRGRAQILQLYGPPGGPPAIVSSGDGGWMHLSPHVADVLAARGWHVVGFDARAYLSAFTEGGRTLSAADVPKDYAALITVAGRGSRQKPVLIGVSEGAGLSVLAATGDDVKQRVAGLVGLGLPDISELGWRWRDMVIYVTHKAPNEPSFSAADIISKVAPLPLAAIHSTHDEFVPVADVQRVFDHARAPKKLWLIAAIDHRFSDNEREFDARLMEALDWVRQNAPSSP